MGVADSAIRLIGLPFTVSEDKRQRLLAKCASGKVLDIGFVQQPNKYIRQNPQVTGLVGMDIQEAKLPKGYDGFVKGSIDEKFPIDDASFDTVIAGEVIEHSRRHVEFVSEIARVLKKGGHFVFSTPNAYNPQWILINMSKKAAVQQIPRKKFELDHVHLFGQKILQEIMHAFGFKLVSIRPSMFASNIVCDFVLEEKVKLNPSPYEEGGARYHKKGSRAGYIDRRST